MSKSPNYQQALQNSDNDHDDFSVKSATPGPAHQNTHLAYAQYMPRSSSVVSTRLPTSSPAPTELSIRTSTPLMANNRIHARQESIDPGELEHQQRMAQMYARYQQLQRQKEERNMEENIKKLEQELGMH